jgi:hypothetical protein
MSTRLEQFMRDHRDEFDNEEPGELVWKKLEQQALPAHKKNGRPAVVFTLLKFSAAAAILVLAGVGVYSLLRNDGSRTPDTAQLPARNPATPGNSDAILKDINPSYAQEVHHFTRLIELKQSELKAIEKDQPHLYQAFVADISKMDSSYNALRKELPANPNREQLLEAMIENLRLQTEILNQQLHIINQIKASKSDSHDLNFKKT